MAVANIPSIAGSFAQVDLIFSNFLAARIGTIQLGRNAGGDVEKHDVAVHYLRQFFNVINDGTVGPGGVQGDEDSLIHVHSRKAG
jgi:hypothetical protein